MTLKNRPTRWVLMTLASALVLFAVFGCTQASRVDQNLRNEADNFKIGRRLVAIIPFEFKRGS